MKYTFYKGFSFRATYGDLSMYGYDNYAELHNDLVLSLQNETEEKLSLEMVEDMFSTFSLDNRAEKELSDKINKYEIGTKERQQAETDALIFKIECILNVLKCSRTSEAEQEAYLNELTYKKEDLEEARGKGFNETMFAAIMQGMSIEEFYNSNEREVVMFMYAKGRASQADMIFNRTIIMTALNNFYNEKPVKFFFETQTNKLNVEDVQKVENALEQMSGGYNPEIQAMFDNRKEF